MVPALTFNSRPSSIAVSDHFQMCGNNSIAERVYYVGTLLMRPFLYQLNLSTKVFGNKRPGKSFEELSAFAKFKKYAKIATVYTIVAPLVCSLIAAIGFVLRFFASFFRPSVSLIDNHENVPCKTYTPEDEIVFMTLNTALMPEFIRNVNEMRSSKKRAGEMGKAFECLKSHDDAPDILCLQECFDSKATSILCDDHLKGIYPYIVYNVDPHEGGLNSGLVIASKFPISEVAYSRYTVAKGEDALAHKGVLGVSINLGSETCWVYNTHLQSKDGKVYDEVRDAQLLQLRDTVTATSRESLAFVLGDFNKSAVDEKGKAVPDFQYNFLGNEFQNLCNSYDLLDKGTWYVKDSTWGTSKWQRSVAKGCILDYIFIRQTGERFSFTPIFDELAEVQMSGMSDHLPVAMRMETRQQKKPKKNEELSSY